LRGFAFPITRCPDKLITRLRRAVQTGPDKPAVGLTGWKFTAPQTVILKERPFLPRMKDLNRQSQS